MSNGDDDKLKKLLDKIRSRRTVSAQPAAEPPAVQQFVDPSRPGRRGDKLNQQLLRFKEARIRREDDAARDADKGPIRVGGLRGAGIAAIQALREAPLGFRRGQAARRGEVAVADIVRPEATDTGVPPLGEDVPGFLLEPTLTPREAAREMVASQKGLAALPEPGAAVGRAQRATSEALPAGGLRGAVVAAMQTLPLLREIAGSPGQVLGHLAGESLGRGPEAAVMAFVPALGSFVGSMAVEERSALAEAVNQRVVEQGGDVENEEDVLRVLTDKAFLKSSLSTARRGAVALATTETAIELLGGAAIRRAMPSGALRMIVNVGQESVGEGAGEVSRQVATGEPVNLALGVLEAAAAAGQSTGTAIGTGALAAARPRDRLQQRLDALRPAETPALARAAPETEGAPRGTVPTPASATPEPEGAAAAPPATTPEPEGVATTEVAGLVDPEAPPVTEAPIMAVQLDNGQVFSDPAARTHAQLVENLALNADQVLTGGFLDKGSYFPDVSSLTRARQERDQQQADARDQGDQPVVDAGEPPGAPGVEQAPIQEEETQAQEEPTQQARERPTQELLGTEVGAEAAVSPRPEEANIEAQLGQARRGLAGARSRLAQQQRDLLLRRGEGQQADLLTDAPEAAAPEVDIFGEVPTPQPEDVERILAPFRDEVRAEEANVLALEQEASQARQDIQRQLGLSEAEPAVFTASDTRTEVRPGAEPGQIAVFNGKTGRQLDRRSRAFEPAIAEYFADQVDLVDLAPRITDDQPDIRLDQFAEAVAQGSENPFEVVEAYRVAQEDQRNQAAGISPVLEELDSALAQGRISTESFDTFGDPNRRRDDRQITLNYLGGDVALDALAEQITTATGIETTPGDLVGLIEQFPGGPRQFRRAVPAILESLSERFQDLTGVRLTGSLVDGIVSRSYQAAQPQEAGIVAPFEPRAPFGPEEITAAAVSVDGRIFKGITHGAAISEARAARVIEQDENGNLVSRQTGEPINLDLFSTNKGNIIDRPEASRRFGSSRSEDAIGRAAQLPPPIDPNRTREVGEDTRAAAYQATYMRLNYPIRPGGADGRQVAAEALTDLREQLDLFAVQANPPAPAPTTQAEARAQRNEAAQPLLTPLEGRLLGRAIAEVLEDRGAESLIGKTVEGPDDFAAIAQVLRDPRFETLRYVFTRSTPQGDQVVGTRSYSVRLPGLSSVFPAEVHERTNEARRQAGRDIDRIGAFSQASQTHTDAQTKLTRAHDRSAAPGVIQSLESDVKSADRALDLIRRATDASVQTAGRAVMRDWINSEMTGLGADGFYVTHNHPTGRTGVSREDVQFTEGLAETFPDTFRSHVVIDSGKFSVMEPRRGRPASEGGIARTPRQASGDPSLFLREDVPLPPSALALANIDPDTGRDALLTPSLDHPSLGTLVGQPLDLVRTASNALRDSENMVVMIGLGADGLVRGLLEVPVRGIERLAAGSSAQAFDTIQRRVLAFARETGSTNVSLGGMPRRLNETPLQQGPTSVLINTLVRSGVFLDVVFDDGSSKQESGVSNRSDASLFGFRTEDLQQAVAEDQAPYDPGDNRKPRASTTRRAVEARLGRLRRPGEPEGTTDPPAPDASREAAGRLSNANVGELHHTAGPLVSQQPRQAVPTWAAERAETDGGRRLLARIQKDTKGDKVGMRSIVTFLNDAIGLEMRVGPENTTRGRPAVYERARHMARSRSGVATHNFHEAGHGISALMELTSPALLQHPGLRQITELEGSLASANTPEEGFAEWVRIFVMDPGRTTSPELADLSSAVLDRLGEHCPACLSSLRDSARLVSAHLARDVAAQFRSMNRDRPQLPRFVDQVRNAVDRVLFTVGARSWAIERTERMIWRAFRENLADRKEADRLARGFFRSVRNTPADLRQAYQSILRITAEVATAVIGTKAVKGLRIFTTGTGVQISSTEAARLEAAGIPLAGAMTAPATKHGTMVQMTDYSLQSVVEAVGSDNWMDFETYAQALVSLERFAVKGLAYPGWETIGPAEMAEIVRIFEEEHPTWSEQFGRLNAYADQMLVVSVAGGLISTDSAVAMKRAWEHYIPLLREPERGVSSRRASSAERVDAGFRRAKGGQMPIMPLLEALEQRTRQVLDAYYTNRAMWAPVKMAEHAQRRADLPFELRTLVGRVVSPLKGITVPVANLSKEEAKVVIAEFLNEQVLTEKTERLTSGTAPTAQELEALRAEGLDEGERVRPSDISLSWSGMDIWRGADPRGINIIAPKLGGEYQFFQVEDPILFDFFAKSADAGEVLDLLFNKILARVVEPWKRALTQNLVFAIRNSVARDPPTAAFYGVSPESASELDARETAKTLLPGYFLATGLVQQLTGRVPPAVVQGELLSRTYQTTTSAAHKARVSRFREVVEEGVVIDGYFQMPMVERLAALPGQVMSALLKPVDIFLWGTGQRQFSQLTEEATRLGAYAAVKKAGLSDEAAQRAYDIVSGNFGERPASGGVSAIYRSAGFLNPATQIAVEMYRRTTSPDPEIRWRAVAARLASTALFTAVAWAVNKLLTSDEREEELKERPDWDRLQYMPIGGYLRLPFDYGPVGAVQSFTWNMLDTAAGDGPRAKNMARIVIQRAIDLPGHPTAFVNPQLLTILENEANYSFFYGNPIEPPYFDFLPPEQRAFYSTPGFYRWMGEMTGRSPVKINHFVRSALSSQLDEGIKLIDRFTSGRPMQDLSEIPLFGKLIQRTPRGWFTRSVGEVVELDEKFRAVKTLYERAIEDPSSRQQDREELARRMNSLARSHQAMLAIQSQQNQIRLARKAGRFDLVPQLQQNMEEIAARALADSGLFPAEQEPVP